MSNWTIFSYFLEALCVSVKPIWPILLIPPWTASMWLVKNHVKLRQFHLFSGRPSSFGQAQWAISIGPLIAKLVQSKTIQYWTILSGFLGGPNGPLASLWMRFYSTSCQLLRVDIITTSIMLHFWINHL